MIISLILTPEQSSEIAKIVSGAVSELSAYKLESIVDSSVATPVTILSKE